MAILNALLGWKGYAAVGGAAAIAAALAAYQVTAWQKDAKYSNMVATHAGVMQAYADRATKAESDEREKEQEWRDARDQIQNDTREQIEKATVALAAVTGERQRLRDQLRRLAPGGGAVSPGAKPAAGSQSEPGQDAIGVFAGLLDRHTSELEAVGGYADQLRIAGLACERAYDSLIQK